MSKNELKVFELIGNIDYKLELLKEKFKINEIEKQIIISEDIITTVYMDFKGDLRTGVYHKSENLNNSSITSLEQVVEWLKLDTMKALQNCLDNIKEFYKLPDEVQLGLILFSFNTGDNFKSYAKFLKLINERKIPQATIELVDTAWFSKNKNKAVKIAKMLVSNY